MNVDCFSKLFASHARRSWRSFRPYADTVYLFNVFCYFAGSSLTYSP